MYSKLKSQNSKVPSAKKEKGTRANSKQSKPRFLFSLISRNENENMNEKRETETVGEMVDMDVDVDGGLKKC